MLVGTKGRFAVAAMLDVALHEASGPVALSNMALRRHISLSYLEQLFSKLRRHKLVTSVRGPGGGYSICGRIDDITLADIISAADDEPPKAKQSRRSSVQEMTQGVWDVLNEKVIDYAHSVTLKSLVLEQLAKGGEIEQVPLVKRGLLKMPVHMAVHPNVPNSVFALGRSG